MPFEGEKCDWESPAWSIQKPEAQGGRSPRRFGPSFFNRSPEPIAVGTGLDDVGAFGDSIQQRFAEARVGIT